ncbi:Hypothetical protein BN69_2980 [Methylocystis sp. SC2]|nr:Hypothetical protein BN69_2980 [Methylocystis sp. SC2]
MKGAALRLSALSSVDWGAPAFQKRNADVGRAFHTSRERTKILLANRVAVARIRGFRLRGRREVSARAGEFQQENADHQD